MGRVFFTQEALDFQRLEECIDDCRRKSCCRAHTLTWKCKHEWMHDSYVAKYQHNSAVQNCLFHVENLWEPLFLVFLVRKLKDIMSSGETRLALVHQYGLVRVDVPVPSA